MDNDAVFTQGYVHSGCGIEPHDFERRIESLEARSAYLAGYALADSEEEEIDLACQVIADSLGDRDVLSFDYPEDLYEFIYGEREGCSEFFSRVYLILCLRECRHMLDGIEGAAA